MNEKTLEVEGKVQIGPKKDFFVLVDGEFLGKMIAEHYDLPGLHNQYCELGNARITVELLQESPTDQG